jgi:hypothetical protein
MSLKFSTHVPNSLILGKFRVSDIPLSKSTVTEIASD